jgi:hypothetical protein
MIAADEINMSIQELRHALKDIPGADGLTINYGENGNQVVTIGNRSVEVRPAASNAEIAAAFANPTVPTSATLPAPRLVPAPITTIAPVGIPSPNGIVKMPSITGASSASMTIKDLIAGSRTAVAAAHNKLIQNAGKVSDAAAALDGLGNDLGSEADDLMSMIGQFKNDLTPSTPAAPAVAPAPAAATPLPAAPTIAPTA